MGTVPINQEIEIDERELRFSFSRSGGPGGQHVNTSSTKVELRWDLPASTALDEAQKALLRDRLRGRLTADGVLVLTAAEHRSQARNREAVLARFAALLAEGLRLRPLRRPSRPSRAARQRRLDLKRSRGDTKSLRRRPDEP